MVTKCEKYATRVNFLIFSSADESADLSVWKILAHNSLKEVTQGTVGLGSNDIQKNFMKLLQNILGADVIARMKQDISEIWYNFMDEIKRHLLNGCKTFFGIQIPFGIQRKFNEIQEKHMPDVFNDLKHLEISFINGHLVIGSSVMESLFKPVTEDIVSEIHHFFYFSCVPPMPTYCFSWHLWRICHVAGSIEKQICWAV